MLPTFIVIGAMKSGTTSLYHYLEQHPEISMSDGKEPNYFVAEKSYSKGLDWYRSLFIGEAKAYGECSTNYTKVHEFQGVPERMHALLPDIKLIYLLRDPVARVVSHYVHNRLDQIEHRSFERVLTNFDEHNKYLATSCYYRQIQPFLKFYSPDQILILSTEELALNHISVLQDIFRFIGVDATFESVKSITNPRPESGVLCLIDTSIMSRSKQCLRPSCHLLSLRRVLLYALNWIRRPKNDWSRI